MLMTGICTPRSDAGSFQFGIVEENAGNTRLIIADVQAGQVCELHTLPMCQAMAPGYATNVLDVCFNVCTT